ncbi:hypothetical protein K523DRAFT_57939 [Schizophyllum commune Tattone D]|nr:hypothetical protein K523DRAFT_57939 [Schizophyllum commune Tattone D]
MHRLSRHPLPPTRPSLDSCCLARKYPYPLRPSPCICSCVHILDGLIVFPSASVFHMILTVVLVDPGGRPRRGHRWCPRLASTQLAAVHTIHAHETPRSLSSCTVSIPCTIEAWA